MSAAPQPAVSGSANANIARHLSAMAAAQSQHVALKIPRSVSHAGDIDYLSLTFRELDAEVGAWTARLSEAGVRRGDRTLLMVRQGLPLIAAAFAIFRHGAVPVVIDPGMGLKSFLHCVAQSKPRALVGIPLAQLVSRVARRAFRSVEVRITAPSALMARLSKNDVASSGDIPPAMASPTDLAAVLFTSGSTGAPKGVCYEHGMFDAQVRLIRETYRIEPGEIDLPLLPIFALFNPALGMTTIVPHIDPRRPATLDPALIVRAIQQESVTNSFGSPTLWKKVADHCVANGIQLSSMRRVLCAGAPVPASLWTAAPKFLPNGSLHSPYGATEALPVATISAAEVNTQSVKGACVGRPITGIDVRIIPVIDQPLAALPDAVPPGTTGEITVRGPVVTKEYDANPVATAAAKIPDSATAGVWHRMGDCGYEDATGRLWFCGRKVERVETELGTLYPEPCEQVFRSDPRVGRCALIGLGPRGKQRPAIVVEVKLSSSAECRRFARELAGLGALHAHTATIRTFYFHPRFPVDVRHNAKIHRLSLAKWARTAKGFEIELKR
jgi:acyl-CoA synthetase (AMP-forming)/AMP-acid ligase II